MEKWKECTISDIGTVVGGSTPSTKVSENYHNGTIAWITPKDLSISHERYIEQGEKNITELGLKSCSTTLLPQNTVLFSSRAPIGYIAIAKNEVCTNQGFKNIIPNKNITPLFLYYLLKYNKDRIENMGSGTTFKEVSASVMNSIVIRIPEKIQIQQKIAKLLGSLDDKIELNRQINTNLEQQARAIFKEMFIQKKGKPVLLSDFCDFIKGKNPAVITSTYQTGAAFYLNIDSLTDIKQTYAIPKNFAMANVKDILMVMDGASSGTVYFGKEGIIGSTLAKIVVSDLSMQEVIYQTLKYFENDVRSHTTGSAIPHVDKQYILQLSVSLPDDYQLYSAYFETIRNMMIKNRTKNICLSTLRDTLLPKLMSGEIDVSKIEVD